MTQQPNPYEDPGLKEAWRRGWSTAGKRHLTRSSNPYFESALKQAWNDGYDARKVTRQKLRMI